MEAIAPILIAFGVLVTALMGAVSTYVTLRAKIAADKTLATALALATLAAEIKKTAVETHDAVNSKMEKVLAEAKAASHAQGVREGKATKG